MKLSLAVKPFNDVFYQNCFYNPFFSGLTYFGADLEPLMANNVYCFFSADGQGARPQLGMGPIQKQDEFALLEEQGLDFRQYECPELNMDVILQALASNAPFFVPIDRYYWSNPAVNSGHYQIMHYPHFLLLFGYDSENGMFEAINVEINGYGCHKILVRQDEILAGYRSYRECFPESARDCFSIHRVREAAMPEHNCKRDYVAFYLSQKEKIRQGISAFSSFKDAYGALAPVDGKAAAQEVVTLFNHICVFKKVEIYKLSRLFPEKSANSQTLAVLTLLMNHYDIMKCLSLKTTISGSDYSAKVGDRLKQAVGLEYQLLDLFELEFGNE